MAAVTLLGAATFSTASGTKTVTATPAVDDLIVIVTAHSGNTSAATPTDNQGGSYDLVETRVKAVSADTLSVFIRTALVTSAVSTVYTHAPGASSGGGLAVLKVTGMSRVGLAAARYYSGQDNQASGGTPTVTLAGAALTTNAMVGAVFNATSPATMTPRASWTERADVGYSTPTTGLEVMSRDSGETASSIAWGGTSASAFASIAVELNTSNPNVTVALTGQGLTAAGGTLSVATAIALVGASLAGGQGGVVASGGDVSVALTGQSLTAARGSLSPASSPALTGLAGAASRGSVAPVSSMALGGQALVGARGSVSSGNSLALTGLALTASQGSVSANSAIGLSGHDITGAQGTITVSGTGDITLLLTGQALTGAIGSVLAVSGAPPQLVPLPAPPSASIGSITVPANLLNAVAQPPDATLVPVATPPSS